MEMPVAKGPQPRNAEEIIQAHGRRIQKLETQLKASESRNQQLEEQIKNSMEVPVPFLPNEVWIEIMSYLSTYDVLRNVAQVSRRFHELSQDPNVIRKIKVESVQSWPKDKEEKYCNDFLGVLKRSLKLKILSFGFGYDGINSKSGKMFLEALPSLNHQFLHEFCLKGDGKKGYYKAAGFLNHLNENNLKYLENCSDLKVLKFEFKPQIVDGEKCLSGYPYLWEVLYGIKKFKFKNLKEFHLIGMDSDFGARKFLERITDNLPKLQRLCLTLQRWESGCYGYDLLQKFASEKSIKIEISSVLKCVCGCPDLRDQWLCPRL